MPWVVLDDADSAISYNSGPSSQASGAWVVSSADDNPSEESDSFLAGALFGTGHMTTTTAGFEFSFDGTAFEIFGVYSKLSVPTANIPSWECFVDGVIITNNNAFQTFPWTSYCSQEQLEDGHHVVALNVQSDSQHPFWLDYIKYIPSSGASLNQKTVLIQSSDPIFEYTPGAWTALGPTQMTTVNKDPLIDHTLPPGLLSMQFTLENAASWTWYMYTNTTAARYNPSVTIPPLPNANNEGTVTWSWNAPTVTQAVTQVFSRQDSSYNAVLASFSLDPTMTHTINVTYGTPSGSLPLVLDFLVVQMGNASPVPNTTPNASTPPSDSTIGSLTTGSSTSDSSNTGNSTIVDHSTTGNSTISNNSMTGSLQPTSASTLTFGANSNGTSKFIPSSSKSLSNSITSGQSTLASTSIANIGSNVSHKAPKVAEIVGGTLGGIIVLLLFMSFIFYRRYRKSKGSTEAGSAPLALSAETVPSSIGQFIVDPFIDEHLEGKRDNGNHQGSSPNSSSPVVGSTVPYVDVLEGGVIPQSRSRLESSVTPAIFGQYTVDPFIDEYLEEKEDSGALQGSSRNPLPVNGITPYIDFPEEGKVQPPLPGENSLPSMTNGQYTINPFTDEYLEQKVDSRNFQASFHVPSTINGITPYIDLPEDRKVLTPLRRGQQSALPPTIISRYTITPFVDEYLQEKLQGSSQLPYVVNGITPYVYSPEKGEVQEYSHQENIPPPATMGQHIINPLMDEHLERPRPNGPRGSSMTPPIVPDITPYIDRDEGEVTTQSQLHLDDISSGADLIEPARERQNLVREISTDPPSNGAFLERRAASTRLLNIDTARGNDATTSRSSTSNNTNRRRYVRHEDSGIRLPLERHIEESPSRESETLPPDYETERQAAETN